MIKYDKVVRCSIWGNHLVPCNGLCMLANKKPKRMFNCLGRPKMTKTWKYSNVLKMKEVHSQFSKTL